MPRAGNLRRRVYRAGRNPVAKIGADGSILWQHGFATLDSSGTPTSSSNPFSVIQTADGGYAVAGNWATPPSTPATAHKAPCCSSSMPAGPCNGNRPTAATCTASSTASARPAPTSARSATPCTRHPDGGYVLAGDSNLKLADSTPIVPWQAKVDASGNLLWQHSYYQTSTAGRPLSEDFQASAPVPGGGSLATGPTLNYGTQKDALYAVETDSSGLAGTCSDVHPDTALQAINPQLAAVAPALPFQTATTPAASSHISPPPTSIKTRQDC